jgi:uncharacterized protein YuzE
MARRFTTRSSIVGSGRVIMKFHYYPETDSLYIDLAERPGVETREVAPGVNLDFDADGKLVGIDIDHASESVNLERLETEALPISRVSLSQT